ncbi:type I restriction enzyme S subunit [Rhodovulum sulfidophilum]|uniref:restriction endonuclease subunit S n=1 Tax=Rhodovulum sulfidophilum TaxID=35806 RepID=UPI0007B548FE|nr:restriction endonuclease subunit S [Rhodovulum sulfidophilum]ANB35797.1 hypothetical protein A6W98_18030 [Rhodovulum sulfidophilum DSM 1374]MCW2305135.1 type I restriction enzyme S subunit [Rhodovulum sulfidophilum]
MVMEEIAALPEDWAFVPLGDLMNFQNGFNTDKSAYGRGLRFANVLELITNTHLKAESIPGRVATSTLETSRYLVQRGDVLFNRTSETQEEVGLASVYLDDEPILFGGFVLRGKLTTSSMDPLFAGYALRSQVVRQQIIAAGQGGIRANIGQQSLAKIKVALPMLPEQEAIAEALSDADALIEGLERLIAKKRLIKQGAMQDLLTAKRRLPGFSGEWVKTNLRKLLKSTPTYGINSAACALGSGGYDYLRITDIDEHGQLRQDGRAEVLHPSATHYFLEPDEIVVARTGASTGKSHQYTGPKERTVYAGFLIKLAPAITEVVPSYLFQFLQTDAYWSWIGENSVRSGQPGINGQQLSGMTLLVPQDLKEQKAIAEVLGDMDAEIQALDTRLEKARQVKEGMMQNLLTGRIRLV